MKTAYFYDCDTFTYIGLRPVHKIDGYDDYLLPQLATFIEVPEFDSETEKAKFDEQSRKWTVAHKFVEVTAYHKQTHETKDFNDSSLITDDYTKDEPATPWDEWINNAWVTNQSNKYIVDYDRLDNVRRGLYAQICDPLIAEANIKRLQGFDVEAQAIEAQALAARAKIQTEHPWPTPPTN
ncbi:hypothetical protein [Vibrio splendidus]|uniref:hypothetical protein n=1 Tax=Vibrio splendidus TaxID=29497 RepID=UPI000C839C2A|nr:hypothetical protein [Vibrio splendidus]PMI78307.1 hypothetical protein BCU38_22675 [Vibrio splendidus]